ncbi:hypothetical protein EO98_02665 [Methanosarcina sp. 2.H.T.1A.6]|nr:hypothetical protein EO97_14520 [Methanosarcina sp. 2.H.T.1A.15]KKG22341.1 hypothetical protein EO98_02665 [Methanosarcina sp. 2.H.T.1A.6]
MYEKGDILFKLHQLQNALEVYNFLIDIIPENPDFRIKKLHTLLKLEGYREINQVHSVADTLSPIMENKSMGREKEISKSIDIVYNLMKNESIDHESFFGSRMGYARAWGELGTFLLSTGRLMEAKEANKTSCKIYDAINKSLGEAQRKSNAIRNYNFMIYENNEDGNAWYNVGRILEKVNESKRAGDAYEKAAQLFYQKGNTSIKKHLYGIAHDSFKKTLEIKPTFGRAWVKGGYVLIKQNEFENAIKYFDKALEINQEDAEAWCFRGIALAKLKMYNDALNSYEKALKIEPQFFEVLYEKGNIYSEVQSYEKALKCYEEALELRENHSILWNNYGFVLGKLEKYKEALEAYDKSLKIKTDYYKALYNKAYVLEKLGRSEESKLVYLKTAESFYETGNIFYTNGNFCKAVEFFENVLKIIPGHVGALSKKASALFKQGNIDTRDILKLVDKSLEIDPKCAESWFLKGEVYYKSSETEKAREFHEKAIKLNPALSEKMSYLYSYDHAIQKDSKLEGEKHNFENWYDKENYVNKYGLYK